MAVKIVQNDVCHVNSEISFERKIDCWIFLASHSNKRAGASSTVSGGSALSSNSNSSHTSSSSSESICTQCSCSGHHFICKSIA